MMQTIGHAPDYYKRVKQQALRVRSQRTYNASLGEQYGIAREIDGQNLAFQADGSRDWRLVKRFDADLMLYGQVELVQAQAAADATR